ncbi:MAG: FAD-dependent oxidoreductase [Chitinivibrionales bacterium]|nr:FAD-dependent oxidoreductase [Chitinivibrionales bacterium]
MAEKISTDSKQNASKNTISFDAERHYEVTEIEQSPCTDACPLGTNVKSYVSLIAAGNFAEALDVVRQTNPFPSICGRVCPHPCEEKCKRSTIDEALSIAALKRFLTDYELRRGIIPTYAHMHARSTKPGTIGIIGAGPAGLTCGADLSRMGYQVTIYEAGPVPGGTMALGIPSYRLPRDILKIEIDAIESLGVSIKLNTRVGYDIKLSDIIASHKAVFIATGAQKPSKLAIEGEDQITHGLIDWVSLLRDAALEKGQKFSGSVLVIGGGNSAIDSSRVALRLGAPSVTVAYRRTREQMPAFSEEVDDAIAEGIQFQFLCAPIRFVHENGRLTGVECVKMVLSQPDKSGRPRPVPVEHSNFIIPCDNVISTIGQEFDTSVLPTNNSIALSKQNLIAVNTDTLATSQSGVFAGGDAVLGPASIVEAVAAGHTAAAAIEAYITGKSQTTLRLETRANELEANELVVVETPPAEKQKRIHYSRLPQQQRRLTFEEINKSYTEAEAIAEASRCMRCGPCGECSLCVGVCEKKQVVLQPLTTRKSAAPLPLPIVRVSNQLHQTIDSKGLVPVSYKGHSFNALTVNAKVNEQACRGCGLCEQTCGYHAIRVAYRSGNQFCATVDDQMCRGCGCCISVCPVNAIEQNVFTDAAVMQSIKNQLKNSTDATVYITCNWNPLLHTGHKIQKLDGALACMCTGRIKAADIIKAFVTGAKKVVVAGCNTESCHYGFGCAVFERNFEQVRDTLELLGIGHDAVTVVRHGESNAIFE